MSSTETNVRARRTSKLGFGDARLDEYFGTWAIAPEHGRGLAQQVATMNVRLHVLRQEAAAEAEATTQQVAAAAEGFGARYGETLLEDGTAIIRVEGTLMKFTSSMSRGTGTVELRRQVRRAQASSAVQRVMLVIDSPGGTVAGTKELADDVAALAAAKPTHAFVEDLMASAALWVGVQASVVSAGDTSLVGSIGTFMAVYDYSKYAAKQGLKVHVVSSDEANDFKGAGTPGTKITDKQLAEWRRVVNGLNAHFLAGVSRGRKRLGDAKVKELADGRVHIASDAKSLGLIDHVEGLDAALSRLRAVNAESPRRAARVEGAPKVQLSLTCGDRQMVYGGESVEHVLALQRATSATLVDSSTESTAGGASAGESETTTAEAAAQQGDDTPPPAGSEAGSNPGASAPEKGADMGQTTTAAPAAPEQPKAASMKELKAACTGAPDGFLVEQAEAGATVAQAKDAFVGFQAAQIRSRDEEIEKLKAGAGKTVDATAAADAPKQDEQQPAAKKAGGVKPLEGKAAEQQQAGPAAGGDAVATVEERVKALTDKGVSRQKATAQVFAADDDLRKEYVAALNAKR